MDIWAASGWGLAGGLCVEALELHASIRSTPNWNWREPIPQGLAAYLISVGIRVGVGAVLAAAMAGSGQVSSPFAAFALGVGAPLILEKLARTVGPSITDHAEQVASLSLPEVQPSRPRVTEPGLAMKVTKVAESGGATDAH